MKAKDKSHKALLDSVAIANQNWLKNKSASNGKPQSAKHPWKHRTIGWKSL